MRYFQIESFSWIVANAQQKLCSAEFVRSQKKRILLLCIKSQPFSPCRGHFLFLHLHSKSFGKGVIMQDNANLYTIFQQYAINCIEMCACELNFSDISWLESKMLCTHLVRREKNRSSLSYFMVVWLFSKRTAVLRSYTQSSMKSLKFQVTKRR